MAGSTLNSFTTNPIWSEEFLLHKGATNEKTKDFNVLRSKTCFVDFKGVPQFERDYVNRNGTLGHNQELIESLVKFSVQYREGGIKTILRTLWLFFTFQFENSLNVGSKDGIDQYKQYLRALVTDGKINRQTARSRINLVGVYLMFNGDISKPLHLSFSRLARQGSSSPTSNYSTDPYTRVELLEIIRVIYSAYKQSRSVIEEHMDRVKSGVRSFDLNSHPGAIFSYDTGHIEQENSVTIEYPITIGKLVDQLFSSAAFIFAYHTWGNTAQILNLTLSELKAGDERSESEYVYKGRGFKFVRLTIGNSDFLSERAGYKWFKDFYDFRERYGAFIAKHENRSVVENLFIGTAGKKCAGNLGTRPLNTRDTSALNDGFLMRFLMEKYGLPGITIPRIRKTCEQFTDQKLNDPFVTIEKAQHTFETYQRSYSKGNPLDAKKNISIALNALKDASVNNEPFEKRQEHLNVAGIHLVTSDDPRVSALANGFGCRTDLPETDIERSFLQKQRKHGKEPKACADLGNCAECEKCAVIEDASAIYRMLSYKHALEFSKVLYKGSEKAKRRYLEQIDVIDKTLGLISPSVIALAEKRITSEGYDPIWLR